MERTPSGAGIRHRSPSELHTDDFYVGGSGGGSGDLSAPRQRGASLSDVLLDDSDVRGHVEIEEEQDARVDREEEWLWTLPGWDGRFAYMEEQRRRRELETEGGGGGDGGDVGFGGEADAGAARQGVPTGVEGNGVPSGVEGDGGGEDEEGDGGSEDEDEDDDEEGSDHGDDHGDDGGDRDDGDYDGDHGDKGRLALVLRDPSVPALPLTRPEAFAQAGFDAEDLARLGSHDPFPHTGRKSDERRPLGGAYSPPPYIVDSPRWSGSSLSGSRGRESGPVDGRSGRRTHRRVSDRMRADYDAGRGAFAGRLSPRFQVAASSEGGSGRPSVHMAGRMLGLSRSATRRVLMPLPIVWYDAKMTKLAARQQEEEKLQREREAEERRLKEKREREEFHKELSDTWNAKFESACGVLCGNKNAVVNDQELEKLKKQIEMLQLGQKQMAGNLEASTSKATATNDALLARVLQEHENMKAQLDAAAGACKHVELLESEVRMLKQSCDVAIEEAEAWKKKALRFGNKRSRTGLHLHRP
ncbi:hypothetical protein CBR_g28570 [Chara braunii]|uniref:Uncharacterized protein n=1 Tax=Chara braunii TaxID=69332 RepID=A0A388JWB1_CHABU|nr:hypothetical protein CBR_g28570 [Chara braunii]|eukprot:GBG62094.1 hypothetical protein CBR_g28570 [Chara braunii]